jgi:hypothetical protein
MHDAGYAEFAKPFQDALMVDRVEGQHHIPPLEQFRRRPLNQEVISGNSLAMVTGVVIDHSRLR